MTPSMLYDGLLSIQSEAGIDLNGGGDRDVLPALKLIEEFERLAVARGLQWAGDIAASPPQLRALAKAVATGGIPLPENSP